MTFLWLLPLAAVTLLFSVLSLFLEPDGDRLRWRKR